MSSLRPVRSWEQFCELTLKRARQASRPDAKPRRWASPVPVAMARGEERGRLDYARVDGAGYRLRGALTLVDERGHWLLGWHYRTNHWRKALAELATYGWTPVAGNESTKGPARCSR